MSATSTINKLSETLNSPGTNAATWSDRIADRFGCTLSEDLADWFDSEVWRQLGSHEFREPVDASVLLEEAPEVIWPGLMPCDFLPVVGNSAGDWLCVRVDRAGHASEVVQWYHGGGDWLPWGRSLSEAIVFDALVQLLPSPGRRHAIPAEQLPAAQREIRDPLLDWALGHLPSPVGRLLQEASDGDKIADTLLEHQIAEVAVRCELVQSALKETLSATLDPATAQQLGVDWSEVVQWMFDTGRMPVETRQRLERDYGLTISKPQNWQAARQHSQRVVELKPELAWAWDVLGYAAQRQDDSQSAIEAYQRAAECSVFTDQSVRLRTHWTAGQAAKFSASQLAECFPEVVQQSSYLQLLCLPDGQGRRAQLTRFWLERADQMAEQGRWAEAHRQYVAAGWDLGAEPLEIYGRVLDRVVLAANHAGQSARAEVARTHRACLSQRYGF